MLAFVERPWFCQDSSGLDMCDGHSEVRWKNISFRMNILNFMIDLSIGLAVLRGY
jgi:hypothetical protein